MLGDLLDRLKAFLRRRVVGVGLPARLVAYALLWWVLTGGDRASFIWGAPGVAAAALFNPFPPRRPTRPRPLAIAEFLATFLWLSLVSALGVGRRALRPGPPLEPAIVALPWRLESRGGRLLMAFVINLMPGSLSLDVGERALTVHVLAAPERTVASLRGIEARIARLQGEEIADD